jgi:large subunit ribosomal protein L1
MNFPVDDMIKNIRSFMTSVKRVTGNTKEAADTRASKSGSAKPGECATFQ